jgi:hypothetical protein
VDDDRFTHDSHDEAHERAWATAEEERTFLRVRDLLMEMHARGRGIYIAPVQQATHGVDGWAVGEFSPDGGQDLAIGPWLDQVVEAARDAAG